MVGSDRCQPEWTCRRCQDAGWRSWAANASHSARREQSSFVSTEATAWSTGPGRPRWPRQAILPDSQACGGPNRLGVAEAALCATARPNDLRPADRLCSALCGTDGTGQRTNGTVAQVLTRAAEHGRGFKVRLANGTVGRCVELLGDAPPVEVEHGLEWPDPPLPGWRS